ncbi:MAG: bacteriocin fulvocin C-related protein [Flavobacteriia bacterium]|nr:bacteriocin fulvocin C-related protein [Flavobacteriia bacterium]
MKFLKSTFYLCFLAWTGCTSQHEQNIGRANYHHIYEMSESQSREWYLTASNEVKLEFWQFKIADALQSFEWTDEQEEILVEMISACHSTWFSHDGRDQLFEFEDQWKPRALEYISKRDLYYLICTCKPFTLEDYYSNLDLIGGGSSTRGPEDETECECNSDSDSCGAPFGVFDLECKTGCSLTTNRGCGSWLAHPCNGTCW